MRRWIIIGVAAGLLLLAGGLVAAYLLVVESRPSGKLETGTEGLTLTSVERTVPRHEGPKAQLLAADKPCWLTFGGNPERMLSRAFINLGRPTRPVWAKGLGGYIEYPAVYCNGRLYVNTYRGKTFAIDALTGHTLWTRMLPGTKPSSPALAGRLLMVASKDGSVTALERESGRTVWQLRTSSVIESSPVVIGRTVYFASQDGRLFAASVETGRLRWAYDTGGHINSSPSVYGRRICITNYSGAVFCLDRRSGRKLWSHYLKRDFVRYESFYASASTDGERLFTVARSGKVVALRASDGEVLWTARVNSLGYSTPAIARGRVFVGDFNGVLHAYNAATGRELWHRSVGGRILGPALVVGDLVFFSTLETKTYAVRFSDGKLVWRIGIGKYAPGIATDRHYFFSLNGLLVAYRGRYSPAEQVRSSAR